MFLAGCTVTDTPLIDPTIVSTSYDYTKPADIAAQSKPVWILPVINKGWIPAHVDPKTGDWVSGHYQATIVQDGYWATQEEAELSGRPYIVAGDSAPIIPKPVTDGPTKMQSGGEIDILALQNRVNNLESKYAKPPEASPNAEQMTALSAQIQALAIDIPGGGQNIALPSSQQTGGYLSPIQVDLNQPPPQYPYPNPQYGTQLPYPPAPNMMPPNMNMAPPGMQMQSMPMYEPPNFVTPPAPAAQFAPSGPIASPRQLPMGGQSQSSIPVINVRPVDVMQ